MTQTSFKERRTCPCKNVPLSLSSFTAAEYGDLHSLQKSSETLADRIDKHSLLTPLHLAAQNDHFAAVAMMLCHGCRVDGAVGDDGGATPLHRASFSGAVAAMRILIHHRANLLAKDTSFNDQMTPLHKAAAGGRYLAVQLLLEALKTSQNLLKEALTANDRFKRTPIQVAKEFSKIQRSERQSVARWDSVAGGVADWNKCVQLLESAETPTPSSTNQKANPLSVTLPANLTQLKDGCIDCGQDENGSCVTASWQAQFQAALGNSVHFLRESSQTLATNNDSKPPINSETKTSSEAVLKLDENLSRQDDHGASCSICSKVTIALYPISSGKLVCKACKRVYK